MTTTLNQEQILQNVLDSDALAITVKSASGTNALGSVAVTSITAGDNNIGNVDIVTMPTGTFAANDAAYGTGVLIQGDDGTDRRAVLVDTDGHLQVDLQSSVTLDITGDSTDLDSGGGTDNHELFAIGLPNSGGHVVGGTANNPIRTDPTGTTTQPISDAAGSLTVDGIITVVQPTAGNLAATVVVASIATGTNKIGTIDVVCASPSGTSVTLTTADTEYSQVLPTNCRRFEFQCRTEATMRFAFVTGKVAASTAPFMTLKAGDWYDSGPINQGASPSTLYVASSTAGVIAEILAWV